MGSVRFARPSPYGTPTRCTLPVLIGASLGLVEDEFALQDGLFARRAELAMLGKVELLLEPVELAFQLLDFNFQHYKLLLKLLSFDYKLGPCHTYFFDTGLPESCLDSKKTLSFFQATLRATTSRCA